MKNIIPILLLLIACNEEDPSGPQMGCITGIRETDVTRTIEYVKCTTKEGFLRGSNPNGGDFPEGAYYDLSTVKWKAISECSKCSASWR